MTIVCIDIILEKRLWIGTTEKPNIWFPIVPNVNEAVDWYIGLENKIYGLPFILVLKG